MLLAHTIAVKGDEVEPVIPEATALRLLHSVLVETDEMNEMLKKGDTQIVTDVNNIHKRSYFSPVLKGENNVCCRKPWINSRKSVAYFCYSMPCSVLSFHSFSIQYGFCREAGNFFMIESP